MLKLDILIHGHRKITLNICDDECDIVKAIKKFKDKFTAGVDSIPSFLMCFATPLTALFNLILKTCIYSDVWKPTKVCHRTSGELSLVINYRLNATLFNFSMILEVIL